MKLTAKFIWMLALFGTTPTILFASDSKQKFTIKLSPLNNSGVTGEAEVEIKKGRILKVELKANGLEANKPHPQHIHGLSTSRKATCPDISADTNADGIISVGEGLPFYGPIVLPLHPFDLVGKNQELRYEAKFTINPASIQPLGKRTIILHGMTVNGTYIPSLPIACGQFEVDD